MSAMLSAEAPSEPTRRPPADKYYTRPAGVARVAAELRAVPGDTRGALFWPRRKKHAAAAEFLHSGIRPHDMSLEQKGWVWPAMPKQEWGPQGWHWIHALAINYPPLSPTATDARAAFWRIWNFVTHLPCEECRMHATQYVLQNPPRLTTSRAFQAWVWRFHNDVNRRLGKRHIPYEEYLRLYNNEICWANWIVGCRVAI